MVRVCEFERGMAVEVQDLGIGIEPAERERIFEAFYRSRREDGGSGFGLGLYRHIMDGHGGRVEVQSEPGRGSTFRLVFPDAANPDRR